MTSILFDKKVLNYAIVIYLQCMYFNEYMIRPFSNSAETILFLMEVYYFLKIFKENNNKNIWIFSLLVPISFYIRSTSAVLFLPMCVYALFKKWEVIMSLIFTTTVFSTFNTILDYKFYEKLVIPSYNFLEFNVIQNKSAVFGREYKIQHFYFLIGYLLVYYPFAYHGFYKFYK